MKRQRRICVEINGGFYESIKLAMRKEHHSYGTIKNRCSSDEWVNYKFTTPPICIEKRCTKCGIVKNLSLFDKQKSHTDGLSSHCRECISEYGKTRYINNKEKITKQNKEWATNNRQKKRNHCKVYRARNPEKVKKSANDSYEKIKTSPMHKLNSCMRSAINNSLKGMKNGDPWEDLVGYTCKELMAHLEKQFLPGMAWENHGKGEGFWEIDHHPIPLYWFVFEKPTDKGFKKAWALENLRPMFSGANQSKGKKLFQ